MFGAVREFAQTRRGTISVILTLVVLFVARKLVTGLLPLRGVQGPEAGQREAVRAPAAVRLAQRWLCPAGGKLLRISSDLAGIVFDRFTHCHRGASAMRIQRPSIGRRAGLTWSSPNGRPLWRSPRQAGRNLAIPNMRRDGS